nr:MAG TPA: hypothetical protein [Bacteriophage sp.]
MYNEQIKEILTNTYATWRPVLFRASNNIM